MKRIIGILAEVDDELNTKVPNSYIKAIEKSGGIPLLLPYVTKPETVDRFINLCDGFCFTGGVDVNPERYGEKPKSTCGKIQYYRDELEFKVLEKIIGTPKPIIAICRGIQLVNVALGGTLYQDIPSEISTGILHRQTEDKFAPSHDVNILPNTPLSALMNTERICGNSFHHQAIKALGRGLEIMALADDGIVEAVYSTEKQYIRAYQWHPERLYEYDGYNHRVFDDFMKACL